MVTYPEGLRPEEYPDFLRFQAETAGGLANTPSPTPPPTGVAPPPSTTQPNSPLWDFRRTTMPTGEVRNFDMGEFNKLPEWLRNQFTWMGEGSTGSEGQPSGYWQAPGMEMKDRSGRAIFQLGPDGSVGGNNGTKLKDPKKKWFDEDLGTYVTDPDNIDDSEWQRGHRRRRMIALGIIAAGAGAGALGLGGTGAAGAGAAGAGGIMAPVSLGSLSIPSMVQYAGLPALAGKGLTLANILNGVKTAGTVANLVNRLTGNKGNQGSRGTPGGSGTPGGTGNGLLDTVLGLGQAAVGQDRDRRNVNEFRDELRTLIDRGDPYGPHRAAAIERLHQLEQNPGSIVDNPLFKAENEKSQNDLQRIYASRGMGVSGNEMGGLQENFLANMNKFYGAEWERIAKQAGVNIDPGTSVRAGLEGYSRVLQDRSNQGAAQQRLIDQVLFGDRGGGNSARGIWDLVSDWFDNDDDDNWTWPDDLTGDENFWDGIS